MWHAAGVHFQHTEGVLEFEPGETGKDIKVLLPQVPGRTDLHFTLFLSDPVKADLYKKRACCDVYFVADKQFGMLMRMVQSILRRDLAAQSGNSAWADQFREAIIPGGGAACENKDSANLQPLDYILHYVSISWKVWIRRRCMHEVLRGILRSSTSAALF